MGDRAKAQCLRQAMRDEISNFLKLFGCGFSLQKGNRLQSAALEMTAVQVQRPRYLAVLVPPKVVEYHNHSRCPSGLGVHLLAIAAPSILMMSQMC